jgi:glyoxylase-like metal-dependent hydrolase (beta-lactamase superfamily II)
MIKVHKLTYNPFSENTYILSDETNECVIIDPGCYHSEEREHLKNYIEGQGLKPVGLWNTHCHLDHVFGNYFVAKEWNLELGIHELDLPTLENFERAATMYGIGGFQLSPDPSYFIKENTKISFGNSSLDVLFVPGHAPGHVVFYAAEDKFVINGDVLFQGSFGRYDLPGGDFNVLKRSIINVMFNLPDDTVVFTGHGPETTIGVEKKSNPILMM